MRQWMVVVSLALICAASFVLASDDGKYHAIAGDGTYKSVESTDPRFPRILCFTATWCGPCRVMKTDSFDWLAKSDWTIDATDRAHLQVIDFDANPELAKKYSISTIPALVLIGRDGEIARSVYRNRGSYAELLKKLDVHKDIGPSQVATYQGH